MTESEWASSGSPAEMLEYITGRGGRYEKGAVRTQRVWPSARKLRLWVEACRAKADPGERFSDLMGRDVSVTDWAHHNGWEKECPLAYRAALLRCVVGNPFRETLTQGNLLTLTLNDPRSMQICMDLAKIAYEDRCPVATMLALADALEEAGCTDTALLGHCRGPGPHARGCWVLDLLLGKE